MQEALQKQIENIGEGHKSAANYVKSNVFSHFNYNWLDLQIFNFN